MHLNEHNQYINITMNIPRNYFIELKDKYFFRKLSGFVSDTFFLLFPFDD